MKNGGELIWLWFGSGRAVLLFVFRRSTLNTVARAEQVESGEVGVFVGNGGGQKLGPHSSRLRIYVKFTDPT